MSTTAPSNKHAATPRRGIPALIRAVRRRYRELGVTPTAFIAMVGSDIDQSVIRRMVGKNPQRNISKKSEAVLRDWLASNASPAACLDDVAHSDAPVEAPPAVFEVVVEAIMDGILSILPLSKEAKAKLVPVVTSAVTAGLEMQAEQQAEATAELISNLETEVAKQRQQPAAENPSVARLAADNERLKQALKHITATL